MFMFMFMSESMSMSRSISKSLSKSVLYLLSLLSLFIIHWSPFALDPLSL